MNKLLVTSALVAAGLVASAGVASAQTPGPIQVVVGGYMWQTFGFASNNDGVTYASGKGVSSTAAVGRMNKTTQQSSTEVFVGGRSTLSNGIVVGFDVQLEGNSNNLQGNGIAHDNIDESYLFVDGAFGRLVVGSENDAAVLLHYSAPAPGATWGANGGGDPGVQGFILPPANVSFSGQTETGQAGDGQRITYFTPRFAGFQAGLSHTPNNLEDINGFVDTRVARANGWSPAVNYVNTIGGIRVAASAGLSYFPAVDGAASTAADGNSIKDSSYGLNLGFGDFTIGGAYRIIDNDNSTTDGRVYAVGAAYQRGPIAASVSYLKGTHNGTAAVGDDTFAQSILSVAYTMGPGVDLMGALFSLSYKDEGGAAANNNSGTGGLVGLRLTF